ncbi:MAG TPA: PqqD family protein [Solirubrobacterales bacterium]|nr:PqqD family protein [Solirubrobacterales bacterium]
MAEAEIGAETTLRRTERAVHGDLPEESVLLDVDSGIAVRLNATGAWIWGQLEEPRKVAELARGLAERFEIAEARAIDDVVAFAREMVRRQLLTTGGAGPSEARTQGA